MNFIKKNIPSMNIICFCNALIILTLLIALFCAIFWRIDGSGIFSIVLCIIFFTYTMNKTCCHKNSHNDGAGGGSDATTNISPFLKLITSPMFISMLPSLLTAIFSYLAKHKEKLSNQVTQELQHEMQSIIDKFNSHKYTLYTDNNKDNTNNENNHDNNTPHKRSK